MRAQARGRPTTDEPDPPCDARIPAEIAAELAGVPLPLVHQLIASGELRAESVKGRPYVALTEVDAVATELAGGGAT